MSSPLVSVLVLSFNRREETLRCLESVRQQTYAPIEMVVLDNGSKDGSADAIIAQFPEARVIRMPCNYGDWEGRDIAAANCRGDYIFSLDNDAVAEPATVEKLVARMEREPELAVAQAMVTDPVTGGIEGAMIAGKVITQEHYRATFLGGAALLRTSALRTVGGFPHYLLGGGEPFVSYRFLDLGMRIVLCTEATIYHRKSVHERIPHQRYFLSTLQRFKALMSHYPGIARPLLEFLWKPIGYGVGAIRRGFIVYLPWDMIRLWFAGARAWRGSWRIKESTVLLIDGLRSHVVTSPQEYQAIAFAQRPFLRFALSRFHREPESPPQAS